jgi:hypothetical protein
MEIFNLTPEQKDFLQKFLAELIYNKYKEIHEKAPNSGTMPRSMEFVLSEIRESWDDYWMMRGLLEGYTEIPEVAIMVKCLILPLSLNK